MNILRWALAGLAAVGFAVWAGAFIYKTSFVSFDGVRRYCLFDDAMISMRYAWNLSHGYGLVWNVTERVEGITNLLMTLYMSVWTFALDKHLAVLAVQISGVVFLLASGYATMRTGEAVLDKSGVNGGPVLSVLFFSSALLYYPLDYWTLMGMENGMLCMLVFAAVWRAIAISGEVRFHPALPVLLGLAFMTRPDTAVFAALIMLHRLLGVGGKKGWIKLIASEVALLAAIVGAVTIFRLAYYGTIVPNTFTLRLTGATLGFRVENGIIFVKPFIEAMALPLALGIGAVALVRNRHVALLLGLFLSSVGYQIYVGGGAWTCWRLMSTMVPILMVLVVVGVSKVFAIRGWLDRVLGFAGGWRFPLVGAVVAAATLCVWSYAYLEANDRFVENITFDQPPMYLKYSKINTDTGLALKSLLYPSATVGVTWAGGIPYYSGLPAIDFLGKNDRYIASLPPDHSGKLKMFGMKTLPGHDKYDLRYSMIKLKPTYVQMFRWGRQNMSKYFRTHYRRVRHKGVWVFVLMDSPDVRWELVNPRYRPDWWKKGNGGTI